MKISAFNYITPKYVSIISFGVRNLRHILGMLFDFLNALIKCGVPKLLEHEEFRWVNISELDSFEFCPADVEILGKLKLKA